MQTAIKAAQDWAEFRTGLRIPETGFYRVIHSQHQLPKEITLMLGETFPRCSQCREPVYFELIRPVRLQGMSSTGFTVALYELPELAKDKE